MVNQIIMWIMAVGAVIGGIDYLLDNKFGLGEKFEDGFRLMGPTAFSMVGILCLAPWLAQGMREYLAPAFAAIGIDAGMLGSVLAIDMGGYQLAMELSQRPEVSIFSGILVAATFGCTISFTIPVGMGILTTEEGKGFAKGILIGIVTLPVVLVLGGIGFGLTVGESIWFSMPLLILGGLFAYGIKKHTEGMVKGFQLFAKVIRFVAVIGLVLGAVSYMTGMSLQKNIAPIEDGMAVASAIGVVMLGSLPIAEVLTRILQKPLAVLEKKTGLSTQLFATLLIATVSAVPAIVMSRKLREKERMITAAYMVSATATLAAHLGFTYSVQPDFVGIVMGIKMLGGITAVVVACLFEHEK